MLFAPPLSLLTFPLFLRQERERDREREPARSPTSSRRRCCHALCIRKPTAMAAAAPPAQERRNGVGGPTQSARPSISAIPEGLAAEPVLLTARPTQGRLDRAPFVMLYSLAAMQAVNVSMFGLKR